MSAGRTLSALVPPLSRRASGTASVLRIPVICVPLCDLIDSRARASARFSAVSYVCARVSLSLCVCVCVHAIVFS